MQKQTFVVILFALFITACNNSAKQGSHVADESSVTIEKDSMAMFPVTDYLLGQLNEVEKQPVTPLYTVDENGREDSVWIKREEIQKFASAFFSPSVDSAFLKKNFRGNSFLDQTIDAVTLTYTALPDVPADIAIREINVYINPQTNGVERLYILKETPDSTLQLTWKAGTWFSIRSIRDGSVRTEKVRWNFDKEDKK